MLNIRLWFIDNPRGTLMVATYRVANFASRKRKESFIHWPWTVPILIFYRLFNELVAGYEIPAATQIGPRLFIDHGYGIVINKHARIGSDVRIKHGVTIGSKTLIDGSQGASPVVGNNVDIGAGAIIIGDVCVGNNVIIGAGAIVTRSIPDNSIVRCEAAKIYENKHI